MSREDPRQRGDARQDHGKVSSSGQGFIGHFSVALSADGLVSFWGRLLRKRGRAQRGVSTQRRQKKMTITEARNSPRESLRWFEGALIPMTHQIARELELSSSARDAVNFTWIQSAASGCVRPIGWPRAFDRSIPARAHRRLRNLYESNLRSRSQHQPPSS
jgi:hypothetical protein